MLAKKKGGPCMKAALTDYFEESLASAVNRSSGFKVGVGILSAVPSVSRYR
jgi:hypothetical protein